MRDDPSPEFEKFIAAAVEDGRYSDRGRVLDEALDLLRRRDALRADVRAGLAELDAGRSVDGDEVFARLLEQAHRARSWAAKPAR